MKFTQLILEEVLGNIMKDIPFMIVIAIRITLIMLWASTSIILIWESVTDQHQINYSLEVVEGSFFFIYSFALLKLFIAVLLSIPKTLKLGLALSFSFFCIYSLYIIYTLHYAATIPWSCIPMFTDTTWDEQLRFNLGATSAIAIVLIISTHGKNIDFR